MVFNYCDNYKFNCRLTMKDEQLEQVTETCLLGVVINDQLTWKSNTEFIVKQAYKRMLRLHKLTEFAVPIEELVDIYVLYIQSIVESSALVWHSSLTIAEVTDIERIQKVALTVIFENRYEYYENAINITGLETLYDRRTQLCKKFATKCVKNEKTRDMFH